jgi:biopolymer transport protein ExbB/TolQ
MPIWMMIVEWLARVILVFLIGLSIYSFAIILEKRKLFKRLKDFENQSEIKDLLQQAKKYSEDKLDLFFSIQTSLLKRDWEKGIGLLGTLGSSTPFIGLLGTILGIIVAFGELSMGKADTNAIMFALAEALILTAVGLFVAIPAVVAFNTFSRQIRLHLIDLDNLKSKIKMEL